MAEREQDWGIWQGKGDAARQKIRVLGWCRDGKRVRFERIAGAPDHALHKEHRVPFANILATFEQADSPNGVRTTETDSAAQQRSTVPNGDPPKAEDSA